MDAPLLATAIAGSLDHLRPWMPWAHDEPQDLQQKVNLLRRFRAEFDREENLLLEEYLASPAAQAQIAAFDATEQRVL